MKQVMGVTRKVDTLGRLVIPIEYRRELGWAEKASVSMTIYGKYVLLEAADGDNGIRIASTPGNPLIRDLVDTLYRLDASDILIFRQLLERFRAASTVQIKQLKMGG